MKSSSPDGRDGQIDPVIAARYPLAEGARTLEGLESGRVRGKSVLVVER